MIITNARIFDGKRFISADTVEVEGGVIRRVFKAGPCVKGGLGLKGKILAPGLVDLHTHASAGIDVMTARSLAGLARMKEGLLKTGVTSFVCAVFYSPADKKRARLINAMAKLKEGSRCCGVYVEGPFINPAKKGAIPERFISADAEFAEVKMAYPGLRIMTFAPESAGAGKAIRAAVRAGATAAFGHSEADYSGAKLGIRAGISHVTHLFNAMRKPENTDTYKAFLKNPRVTVELIADGKHVAPKLLRKAYRLFGRNRIILISDMTAGKGFYNRGARQGSKKPLISMARNMMKICGIGAAEALQMASYNPAKLLGEKAGRIKPEYRAEFIVTDEKLKNIRAFVFR